MRYSVFSNSNCSLLNILNIGYAADSLVTRFGPGVRNSYIIHYVLSGKGYFNANAVSAGQGFFITPGMHEHYYPDPKEPWEFLWVISDDQKMVNLFETLNADQGSGIFDYAYVSQIKALSSFLVQNNNKTYNGFEMLELFLKIFKFQHKNDLQTQPKTNAEIYMHAAEKYIRSNLHRSLTVSELTGFLGITQPYLYKIFKENFSKSPKQYILEQKLDLARTLLKHTDLSITHIANSVGFPDVLSFSKCFRSKLGISPQNYRKVIKKA